jgi:uncharacterized protein
MAKPEIAMRKRALGPVPESERIVSLDVLRGFALLGILTMNMGSFAMPSAAYFDPTAYGDLSGLNGWIWRLIHLVADLKFMAIFSMLFGAGIVLSSRRTESRGRKAAGVHYRRMFWLIVFGLLHAYLLWYGDILFWYGMCGLIVFFFRRVSPKWLIVWGLISISVASAFMLFGGLTAESWPQATFDQVVANLKPSEEAKEAEIAIYRGDWLEQMEMRVPESLEMQTGTFLSWALWRVGGLMLLGMALFKLGVFSATRSRRFYLVFIGAAVLLGLPVIGFGIRYNFGINWEAPYAFFYGMQFNYWASIMVSLGWIGAVMLVCKSRILSGLTFRLAAVGRTAFSNYILQTILCTSIFYGHGFGLFGGVERGGLVGIMILIWIFQLAISPAWLEYFHFGPLEWVWRSLVYLKKQPFRRVVGV